MLGISVKYAFLDWFCFGGAFFTLFFNLGDWFIFEHFKSNTDTWHQGAINQKIMRLVSMYEVDVFGRVF